VRCSNALMNGTVPYGMAVVLGQEGVLARSHVASMASPVGLVRSRCVGSGCDVCTVPCAQVEDDCLMHSRWPFSLI
jgi:hypothetical protein